MTTGKSTIRIEMTQRIRAWAPSVKARLDIAILEHLRQVFLLHPDCGGTLLAYAPLPDEPDCMPWLREEDALGRRIVFPRLNEAGTLTCQEGGAGFSALRQGRYGILEPAPDARCVSLDAVRVILVPGRAFTVSGARLGRGGGHYDRLLRGFGGLRIALAYEEQIRSALPVADHDEPVDLLVTPDRILPCA